MGTLQENQSLNAEYERNKKERKMKEEIERLNNELKLYKDNHEHLNNLLQQKDNIIKEARELIEIDIKGSQFLLGINDIQRFFNNEMKKLLEILDKENNND